MRKLILIVGSLCVLVGIVVFISQWKTRLDPHKFYIQRMNPEEGWEEGYLMNVPKGGWYDTGVWAKPITVIFFKSGSINGEQVQPFEMKIGEKQFRSGLNDHGLFLYMVSIEDNVIRQPPDKDLVGSIVTNKPEKIYVKMADDASGERVGIIMGVSRPK